MSTKTERATSVPESVAFACTCGSRWAQVVLHYDVVKCSCGVYWWALRPKRNGPLVAHRYPEPERKLWAAPLPAL